METTSFYRKFYGDAGFELGDMDQEGWFEKLPILTKAHIRENFEEMTASGLGRFRAVSTTGGSTGVPTRTGYDCRNVEEVYGWRLQNWFGVHPGDDRANVWRPTRQSALSRFINSCFWWPTRKLMLDATFVTEESLRTFIEKFNKIKPASLEGYVGGVVQLAEYIHRNNVEVWSPKLVQVTSAPVSEVQKQLLRKVFRAPVCNQYGSCEIRWIAQSCPEDHGLHVNAERVHVEFVEERNGRMANVDRGEYGRTLLTNLEDFVFPMIRYENGDRGRWLTELCPCGRTLPLVDSVKGRESESFTLPSGKVVNGEFMTTIFDNDTDLVLGFRVVQHKNLSVTVEYLPSGVAGSELRVENLVKAFAQKMGGEVPVDAKAVTEIPHDGGKIRFVVKET